MTPGLALLVALALPSHAVVLAVETEAPGTSAHLDVRAAPACTSRGEVAARVGSRSSRIHFVESGAALSVEATFTDAPSGEVAVGLVVAGHPAGKAMSRRFIARSCAEGADAAALIIAVTLDPTSASEIRPAPAESGSRASSPGSSDSTGPVAKAPAPAASSGAKQAEQAPEPARLPAPTAAPAAVLAAQAPPVATRRRAGLFLAGQMVFGPAPAVMPGVGLYALAALDRDALWSPAVVLGATHAWRSGLVETGGTAAFTLEAATLDACALRVHLSRLEGRACASTLVGRLLASGSGTSNQASVPRPFATAGASAVFSAGLGSRVELSARVGAGVTLVRDWYVFGPNLFHRAARVTVDASLGLGVRLP
jgi:hypothetical protein